MQIFTSHCRMVFWRRMNTGNGQHRSHFRASCWIFCFRCLVVLVCFIHSKKRTTCSGLMKTALNNLLLPTLFKVVNNIVQHCYTRLQANSGSSTCSVLLTTLNNVGSTTLFKPVFIRREQVVRFLLCRWMSSVDSTFSFGNSLLIREQNTQEILAVKES